MSLGQFSWGRSFLRGHFSEEQLCRWQLIRKGIFIRGNYLWGNCPGAKIREQSSRGTIFLGGNYPWWQLSGVKESGGTNQGNNHPGDNYTGAIFLRGNYPWEQLYGDHLSSEAIILGVNCPGGNNPEGKHPRSNCPGGNYPGGNFPREQLPGHHEESMHLQKFFCCFGYIQNTIYNIFHIAV